MDDDAPDSNGELPAVGKSRTIYLIKNADLAVRTLAEPLLRGIGLTLAQYTVLSLVARRENLSSAALARRLGTTPQSANEVISYLAREGFVERVDHPEHGRIRLIKVTRAGQEKLRAGDVLIDHVEQTLFEGIPASSLDLVRQALTVIAGNGLKRRAP